LSRPLKAFGFPCEFSKQASPELASLKQAGDFILFLKTHCGFKSATGSAGKIFETSVGY